ncbi:MAG: hypothetical protein CL678_18695 [Bdellovibrionaceae bacterium]|nr:hypothetical protein [Pseudobdellovibrionaceae bacterium]
MRRLLGPLLVFLNCLSISAAEFRVDHQIEYSDDPLTTESVWKWMPEEENPHRRRWALRRKLEIEGLDAIQKGKNWVLKADIVIARTRIYLRPSGPWYSTMDQFSCFKKFGDRFATAEGTAFASKLEAQAWGAHLKKRIYDLQNQLSRVRSDSKTQTMITGQKIFKNWLIGLERSWRDKNLKSIRVQEWKHYLLLARKTHSCKKNKGTAPLPWKDQMEALGKASGNDQRIGRVPARLWGGAFSIRASFEVNPGVQFIGKFLIDPSLDRSLISPVSLENQGVSRKLLNRWIHRKEDFHWRGKKASFQKIPVQNFEVSGVSVSISELGLSPTLIFQPPEYVSTCCDGVLGKDFLRQFVVEFDRSVPSHIFLWKRSGFALKKTPWIEISSDSLGRIVSECSWKTKIRTYRVPTYLRMGKTSSVVFSKKTNQKIDLSCNGVPLFNSVFSKEEGLDTSIGMGLLSERRLFLDLSHGRLWIGEPLINDSARKLSRSIELKFEYENGKRVLRVKRIKKVSPYKEAIAKGLGVSTRILKINGTDVDELDLWQVQQKLCGQATSEVSLLFKKGTKNKSTVIQF